MGKILNSTINHGAPTTRPVGMPQRTTPPVPRSASIPRSIGTSAISKIGKATLSKPKPMDKRDYLANAASTASSQGKKGYPLQARAALRQIKFKK